MILDLPRMEKETMAEAGSALREHNNEDYLPSVEVFIEACSVRVPVQICDKWIMEDMERVIKSEQEETWAFLSDVNCLVLENLCLKMFIDSM